MGGDLCSGPQYVSVACCLAVSIAGYQFQVPNITLPQGLYYQLPWGGSLPQNLDRGLIYSLGNFESKKVLQIARKNNLKLIKSCAGAFGNKIVYYINIRMIIKFPVVTVTINLQSLICGLWLLEFDTSSQMARYIPAVHLPTESQPKFFSLFNGTSSPRITYIIQPSVR